MNFEKLKSIDPPHHILDIGANVGEFSRALAGLFPQARIIQFEANKNCEPWLMNSGHEYHIIGLADRYDSFDLYMPAPNSVGTGVSFYKENTEHYSNAVSETVEVVPLDSFNLVPDFIKVDVQGAELDVINGGVKTFGHAKYALVEVSLAQYNEGAPLCDVIIDRMKELGFGIEDILEYHSSEKHYGGCIFQLDILFKK